MIDMSDMNMDDVPTNNLPIDTGLTWEKGFNAIIDLGKAVLPAALDKPGATGRDGAYADRVAPSSGVKGFGGSNSGGLFSGNTPLVIGGVVVLIALYMMVKK